VDSLGFCSSHEGKKSKIVHIPKNPLRAAPKMNSRLRDRLVGGLGGGGGTLVFYPIFVYVVDPSLVMKLWLWTLGMEFVGIVLVSLAVFLYFKKITVP
jgi:hypothetical protein